MNFIANAPEIPPKWWKPIISLAPISMMSVHNRFRDNKLIIYFNDEDNSWPSKEEEPNLDIPQSFKDEVIEYQNALENRNIEFAIWEKYKNYETYFQWPFYYADQITKRLNNEEDN